MIELRLKYCIEFQEEVSDEIKSIEDDKLTEIHRELLQHVKSSLKLGGFSVVDDEVKLELELIEEE